MGLRFRKSFGSGPFRATVSKSGVGWSVGGKGYRYTKKAGGGTRTTTSIPGTGVSYVKDSSRTNRKSSSADRQAQAPISGGNPLYANMSTEEFLENADAYFAYAQERSCAEDITEKELDHLRKTIASINAELDFRAGKHVAKPKKKGNWKIWVGIFCIFGGFVGIAASEDILEAVLLILFGAGLFFWKYFETKRSRCR